MIVVARIAKRPPRSVPPVQILFPPLLILLLALLPPETRGQSAMACAALVLLWALVRADTADGREAALMSLLLLAVVPLGLASPAVGLVVEPFALVAMALVMARLSMDNRVLRAAQPALVASLGVAVSAVALYGLYQVAVGLDHVAAAAAELGMDSRREALVQRALEGRAFALFPTPAALAGFLGLTVPMLAGAAIAGRGRLRFALGFATIIGLAGILATRSVTGAGALLGALVLAVIAGRQSSARRLLSLGIAILGLVLVAAIAWRGLAALDLESSRGPLRLRAANAGVALEMIADHPWAGVGVGGFAEAYPRYRGPGDNETRHAHNLPLELVAELGLPVGLLAVLAFFFVFLGPLVGWCTARSPLEHGAAIGLGAFALHSLGDFTAHLPSVLWTAAIVRGSMFAPPPDDPFDEFPRASRSLRAWWALPRFAVVLVAVTVISVAGRASEALEQARHAARSGDLQGAAHAAARAARWAPWSAEGPILLAEIALSTPDSAAQIDVELRELAFGAATRAVALAPDRAYARYLRARARLGRSDLPGAYTDAREAARLYPMRRPYAEFRDQIGLQSQESFGGGKP